jgi:hypothetical protein
MSRSTALALVVLVSCGGATGGGTGGGGGSGGGGLTADQACTSLATAICNKTSSCFPFAFKVNYADLASCIVRAKQSCVPALAAPGTGATAAKIDDCAKGFTAQSCADDRIGARPAACAFSGTLAAGIACGSSAQCATGYCKLTTPSCGVCSNRVAATGACSVDPDCVDGHSCVAGACVALKAVGAVCNPNQPCFPGLYCKAGVCAVAPTSLNAACDGTNVDSCDFYAGVYCNDSSVCGQVQTTSAGSMCGLTSTTATVCVAQGTCRANGGLIGTCVAPAEDGQSCNPNLDLNCLEPAVCEGGVCKLANPAACK